MIKPTPRGERPKIEREGWLCEDLDGRVVYPFPKPSRNRYGDVVNAADYRGFPSCCGIGIAAGFGGEYPDHGDDAYEGDDVLYPLDVFKEILRVRKGQTAGILLVALNEHQEYYYGQTLIEEGFFVAAGPVMNSNSGRRIILFAWEREE